MNKILLVFLAITSFTLTAQANGGDEWVEVSRYKFSQDSYSLSVVGYVGPKISETSNKINFSSHCPIEEVTMDLFKGGDLVEYKEQPSQNPKDRTFVLTGASKKLSFNTFVFRLDREDKTKEKCEVKVIVNNPKPARTTSL